MLCDNIRIIRKKKGLSQEELSKKVNVVRQTVSKWEQGLSVPDADMLILLSKVLETPVSVLLGETTLATDVDDIKILAAKLETINFQFAQKKARNFKLLLGGLISLCVIIVLTAVLFIISDSPYLLWDCSNPETAIAEVFVHTFEWFFFRVSPVILLAAITGIIVIVRKKRSHKLETH